MNHPILITGVGKRVGFALAKHLIENGHRVIGTYRTERLELETLYDKGVELYQCDLSVAEDIEELVSDVKKRHEGLRALIHNASDWHPDADSNASVHKHSDIMISMMQVHAVAVYQLNLAFRDLLENNSSSHGDIIHISDYVAEKGSKKHIAYAASKAALNNLSLSFAQAYAPKVKVNTISPALILFNEGDDEAYKAKALNKALIPREGGLDEVIASVNYLLNSDYVTGRVMHLDGGRHLK